MSGDNSTASDTGDARPRARPDRVRRWLIGAARAYGKRMQEREGAVYPREPAEQIADLRAEANLISAALAYGRLSDGALGRQDETPPLLRDEP